MTRPFRAIAATAVAALTLLAACSSDTTSSSTAAPATTGPATTAPTTVAATTTEAPSTTATPTTMPSPQYAATVDDLLQIGRPIVLAHTAGEDNFPASTMFAFGESVKAGVDMLDLNVMLTKDGQLVVQHDDGVDRNTNGTGKVADLTYDQIKVLDAAYWFTTACSDCHDKPAADYLYRGMRTGEVPPPDGYAADDFALPTLTTLVQKYPDIPLNIEIKGEGDAAKRAADELNKELRDLHREKASVVASFQDDIVSYFHSIAPDVEVSPGLGVLTNYVLKGTAVPDGMRILQLPPEYSGLKVITPELVAKATAAGYPIWVWPNDRKLENLDSYTSFLQMGVVGLNINFPSQGVDAVRQFTALSDLRASAPSAGCGSTHAALSPETTVKLTAAGKAGIYIRHLPPAYDGSTPLPLVVDLHGWSEPAAVHVQFSGMPAYGDTHRFVTLTPDITRPVPLWDTSLDGADVKWIGALLDEAGTTLCIDTNRIYVTGMSNGAMMTSTLACVMADRIAAVAPVAGVRNPAGCSPSRPMPLVAFHGTADPYLAYTGGYGPKVASLPTPDGKGTIGTAVLATGDDAAPVPDMVAAWATRGGCSAGAGPTTNADITIEQWTCPKGVDVALYTVEGGGHSWPGSKVSASAKDLVGPTTMTISANALMWSFFQAHPLTS